MIPSVKRIVFQVLVRFLTLIAAPRVIRDVAAALKPKWSRLSKADIVLFGGGGFGFTIIFPDAARRLYGPGRCCMLFVGPRGRYNPLVEGMFPDIDLVIVSVDDSVRIAGRTIAIDFQAILIGLIFPVLRWRLERAGKRVINWSLGMHEDLPYPDIAGMPGGRFQLSAEMHRRNGFPRYYRLRRDVAAPPMRLPEDRRRVVDEAIRREEMRTGRTAAKTCCLYTRYKGDAEVAWDAFVRSGSPLEDYEPAIDFLVSRGYRILVIGDRKLSDALADRFDGMLVDARRLQVDGHLFAVYAATEGDFFLGEAGGGVDPPMVADRPCLLVNWLQYYAVVPKATHYYKHLRAKDGTLLPPTELFGRFAWDLEYRGYEVCTNSPAEILAAVKDFVERLETGQPLGLEPSAVGGTSPDMWFHFTDAYISPPWLARFVPDGEGRYTVPAPTEDPR